VLGQRLAGARQIDAQDALQSRHVLRAYP
jgi:hypothetical protein